MQQLMTAGDIPLIRTKLAPPRIGGAPVMRSSLLAQLDTRRDRKLSLVLGPAGSGKTQLLTQWRKQLCLQGAAVAWYNAGQDDDDADIAAYIVEGLRQAGLPIDSEGLQLYSRSGAKAWKPLLGSMINVLCEHAGEVYLFVDDFHYVSSFGMLRLVDRLLGLAPPGFHLVLASRLRPPLDLVRLRSEDQLTEFNFSELRFSLDETQQFAEGQKLPPLSAAQVRALHDMTDGWVAGLQLLLFSMRKAKSPISFFASEGGVSLVQEQAMDDYLEKATIEHLSEEELSFLTRVSACRRINRELCELLTGDPKAAEYLARFEADNLFLLPIDTADAEPWYRFHRLFLEFLNKRLRRIDEAEVRKLHQLASHWFAARNLHVEAMRHARLAGDTDFLLELMDRSARRTLNSANFLELLRWSTLVPRERLATRLNICLCMAWAQISCSRAADFEQTMADIERHPASAKAPAAGEVHLLKAYRFMQLEDSAAALQITGPMLLAPAPESPLQALLLAHVGSLALVYANQFEKAREVVRSRQRLELPERPDYARPLVDVVPGFSYLMQGHIRLALTAMAPVVNDAARLMPVGADVAGLFGGYFVEAHYQANELDRARDYLDRYADVIDAVGAADAILFAYRVRARLANLNAHTTEAQELLQQLEDIGLRQNLDRLVAWSLYEQLQLAIAAQHTGTVRELLHRLEHLAGRYESHHDCLWAGIGLAWRLGRADAALAGSLDAACLEQIDAASVAARSNRRELLCTRLRFMRAAACLRGGQPDQAVALGREALRVALDHGMNRVLADIGGEAPALASALLDAGVGDSERSYLLAVCAGTGAAEPGEAARPAKTGIESGEILSSRELEVLNLLSRALSTKSIARALDLSSGTVKWHLKNVYGKLNAASREDALAKARALRILQ
jgi:LuxR family maltose regulon positive regulatory protein